jgi:hypothetical protein
MAIRYYPKSKIKPPKNTIGGEFTLSGKEYKGKYYETFDGKFYTGENPIYGKNELLKKIPLYINSEYMNTTPLPQGLRKQLEKTNKLQIASELPNFTFKGTPTSYFPQPIESDYTKGYLNRYFTKKINTPGYVIEISPEEYAAIKNGTVSYNVAYWMTQEIFWKLTGPLNQVRISQYDIRAGIIDTNKRLVETADKTFIGIKDFIDGNYAKFARPTK